MKAQGALIRSRFQSISQMDTPSNFFFFQKEKMAKVASFIHCAETGKDLTESSEISKHAVVVFFINLYKCELSQREGDHFF